MYFDFNLSLISYLLFGAAMLSLILIIVIYCGKLRSIVRAKKNAPTETSIPDGLPFASIIVYARNESDTLSANLPHIMQQEYPAGFEVIVVNDGASPETSMVVGTLKAAYPNLYLTFTPDGARNLSRKKLGLTLGIKAAKGPIVVITDANTHPLSKHWLAQMIAPFADSTIEVVLGPGVLTLPDSLAGHYTRIFDYAADTAAWLTEALDFNPYRGNGFNLAYKRQLFFDNKGFSSSLNLRNGDDDIFVNEITNGHNTAVQMADDAIMEKDLYPLAKGLRNERIAHAFTGRELPKGSRRTMAFGEWLMWIVAVCSVAGAFFAGIGNGWGWTLCGIFLLTMLITVGASWSSAMKALRLPSLPLHLPFAAMTRPLRNMLTNLRSHSSKANHYTWQ